MKKDLVITFVGFAGLGLIVCFAIIFCGMIFVDGVHPDLQKQYYTQLAKVCPGLWYEIKINTEPYSPVRSTRNIYYYLNGTAGAEELTCENAHHGTGDCYRIGMEDVIYDNRADIDESELDLETRWFLSKVNNKGDFNDLITKKYPEEILNAALDELDSGECTVSEFYHEFPIECLRKSTYAYFTYYGIQIGDIYYAIYKTTGDEIVVFEFYLNFREYYVFNKDALYHDYREHETREISKNEMKNKTKFLERIGENTFIDEVLGIGNEGYESEPKTIYRGLNYTYVPERDIYKEQSFFASITDEGVIDDYRYSSFYQKMLPKDRYSISCCLRKRDVPRIVKADSRKVFAFS